MQIAIGSYDGLVAGYQLTRTAESANGDATNCFKFTQKFNDNSHLGCVKSLAVSPKGILASGSTDETIHLFNLEREISIGTLVSHEGDITCLKFVGKDFLYSGSADGTIRMWRTRIWELQRTFKGHKGAVLHFDVHPSKKLALSVGADKKLIAWDLVAGKYSFIRNMKKVCEAVVFNKSGTRYAIRSGSTVDVYDLTATEAIYTEDIKCHINDTAFLNDDVFVVAGDSESLILFDAAKKCRLMEFASHKVRVRAVVPVRTSSPDSFLLFSCSSDETVKAWSLQLTEKTSVCLASINVCCRITSMAVHAPGGSATKLLTAPDAESVPAVVAGKKKKNLTAKKVLPDVTDSTTKRKGILKDPTVKKAKGSKKLE
ncbi:putative p21-activated protein kinase-interacting protein 1-like [Hypsibius exemplaris]|uniref:P21-activated protein kinase-interacting protein 1-like n=1 Tax=Hypsibius exemplaris TaxID=2072580 RepID=A0A9X6NCA3_HYPEX|nr:putative p21-activated protein kinase-interacting protein 1-like [Hypsibius exemplaris]